MRTLLLSGLVASVTAFPSAMLAGDLARAEDEYMNLEEARAVARSIVDHPDSKFSKRADPSQDPLKISKAQTNCGPTPCLNFDPADQLVSVTGAHAYASPAADEIRGPCPGLNAASNHGYLPRSGIVSLEETVSGLGALYNMSPELGAALAAYAIAVDGNIVEGVWSIGGPLPPDELTSGIVGTGQGLSYSHNNYEGDGSIGRADAYVNKGDAHSLNISKFEEVYKVGGNDLSLNGRTQRYTLDKFRQGFERVQGDAIATNPYYFTGAFSTFVVVPAAYNFVINFMSNHSAEEPSGYLDGYNFKSFFGVTGKPGSFKWIRGQERVPENWYRRPTTNQYTANDVFEDVGIGYAAYPKTLIFGGNTGKPNSFVGVSITRASGQAYNAQNLFKGNNFGCFAFGLAQQGLPAFLKGPLASINNATSFVDKYFGAITGPLGCKQLGQYDQGLFNKYPGRSYNPTGAATNY